MRQSINYIGQFRYCEVLRVAELFWELRCRLCSWIWDEPPPEGAGFLVAVRCPHCGGMQGIAYRDGLTCRGPLIKTATDDCEPSRAGRLGIAQAWRREQ
jgi:hypothetical protein